MFTKEAFKAKMYNLKSVVDGMITAVEGGALSTSQGVDVVNSCVSKLNDENEKAKGGD